MYIMVSYVNLETLITEEGMSDGELVEENESLRDLSRSQELKN